MFARSFNRSVATRPGSGIVCGGCDSATAGYRLTNGAQTIYRCPACASGYDNRRWQAEALPHIAKAHDDMLYQGYVFHRGHGFTPEQLASIFTSFRGRVEAFEARYQAEAGKRAVS